MDTNILLMKRHMKIILHAEGIPKTNKLTYTKTVDGHGKKDTFPLFVIQGGRCHGGNSSRERGSGVNVGGRRPYRSCWSCHDNRGDAQEKPFSWPCPSPPPPKGSQPRSPVLRPPPNTDIWSGGGCN